MKLYLQVKLQNFVCVNLEFQEPISEGHIPVKYQSKKLNLVQPSGSRIRNAKFYFTILLNAVLPLVKALGLAISMPVSPSTTRQWS